MVRILGSVALSVLGFALAVAGITAAGRGVCRLATAMGWTDATGYLARTAEAPWIGGAMATGAAAALLLPAAIMLTAVGLAGIAPGFVRRAGPMPVTARGRSWHALAAFGAPVVLTAMLVTWFGAVLFRLADIALAAQGGAMQTFARWGAGLVGG